MIPERRPGTGGFVTNDFSDQPAALCVGFLAGWGTKRIAAELGCSRNTVKRYIETGDWVRAVVDPLRRPFLATTRPHRSWFWRSQSHDVYRFAGFSACAGRSCIGSGRIVDAFSEVTAAYLKAYTCLENMYRYIKLSIHVDRQWHSRPATSRRCCR
ncbi:helix-turn-helix domain-containing protein [Phenylobacterium sp.]|uniref:helix-turn-helix domain-containing protein n=1 Tax=Phenylobacterium sp. TaxID=1871053 RepID=UPI0039C95386